MLPVHLALLQLVGTFNRNLLVTNLQATWSGVPCVVSRSGEPFKFNLLSAISLLSGAQRPAKCPGSSALMEKVTVDPF